MSSGLTLEAAQALLHAEALALDERRWDDWLTFYVEDAVYWVPAWKSEGEPTSDPDREISLIYYDSRSGLEDRIWRLRSGASLASTPLRRTAHLVSNIQLLGDDEVAAAFAVHTFDPRGKTQHAFFGRYLYALRREGEDWRIARKVITLMNDVIPAVADVYML